MGAVLTAAPPLRVHRATARDLDDLRRLCLDASRNASAVARRDPVDPGDWITLHVPVIVASEGTATVGFAAALSRNVPCAAPRCAELVVYVNPDHRRRGAARRATSELMTVARTTGLWKLLAYATPEDAAAQALLSRFEFREVGVFVKHLQLEGGWRDITVHERLLMTARRSLPSISGA
jgi:L-amino acid N-acyltransferase YncA